MFISDFRSGLSSIKEGWRFLKQHKNLWIYAIIPTLINIALLITTIYVAINYFPALFSLTLGKLSLFHIEYVEIWQKMLFPFIWLLKAFIFLFFFIFALLACSIIGLFIASPFNDILSEKSEKIMAPDESIEEISFIKAVVHSISIEIKKNALLIFLPIVLFVMNFIPIVGTILYLILLNLIFMFDLGFSYLDYPMSRRGWSFKERLRFSWNHKFAVCGLGIIAIIPLMPFILNSPLVVAGTILFRRMFHVKHS